MTEHSEEKPFCAFRLDVSLKCLLLYCFVVFVVFADCIHPPYFTELMSSAGNNKGQRKWMHHPPFPRLCRT